MDTKVCSRCDTKKPRSEFHKNRNRADGLNGFCKICIKVYFDARSFDPAEISEITCAKCCVSKPVTEFNLRRASANGYAHKCKDCCAAYNETRNKTVDPATNTKRCNRCETVKNIDEFCKNKRSKDGLNGHCKSCSKGLAIKRKYDITEAEYFALREIFGDRCGICSRPEQTVHGATGKPRPLAVDHCHTTGKIRGLLCSKCNMALGLLGDTAEAAKRAVEYLEKENVWGI